MKAITLLLMAALLAAPVFGQSIKTARADLVDPSSQTWRIQLEFDREFDPSTVNGQAANFSVLDYAKREFLEVRSVQAQEDRGVVSRFEVDVTLTNLDPERGYLLIVSGVTFTGTTLPRPLTASLEFSGSAAAPAVASSDFWSREKAKGRSDANVYFSGEITTTRGDDWVGSLDLKLERPWAFVWGGRDHNLGPFFNLRGSSDAAGDADSMDFGARWEMVVRELPSLWTNHFKIEGEKDLDNANFFWETRKTFVPERHFGDSPWLPNAELWWIRPFLGAELGADIDSPFPQLEGRLLARLLAGAGVAIEKGPVTLTADYVRRWPLRDELSVKLVDQTRSIFSLGKGPRDHVKVLLVLNWSDFFGSSVSYEYGELPPSFNLVDHRFAFGLTYKAIWKVIANQVP